MKTAETIRERLSDANIKGSVLDLAEEKETTRLLVRVIDVFSYGFIILVSLIAVANVFNTISTNILLRRREFAIYKSIGLSEKGFRKMTNEECLIYGLHGLVFGLSLGILAAYAVFRVTNRAYEISFFVPLTSILIDALKNEIQ